MKTLIITLTLTLTTIFSCNSPTSNNQDTDYTDHPLTIPQDSIIKPYSIICYGNSTTLPTIIQPLDTIYSHTQSFKAFINKSSTYTTINTSDLLQFEQCTNYILLQ